MTASVLHSSEGKCQPKKRFPLFIYYRAPMGSAERDGTGNPLHRIQIMAIEIYLSLFLLLLLREIRNASYAQTLFQSLVLLAR